MKQNKILVASVLCAALVWVAESILDAMVFRVNELPGAFFPIDSPQDLYFRWITVIVILGAGVLLWAAARYATREQQDKFYAEEQLNGTKRLLAETTQGLNLAIEESSALRGQLDVCREALSKIEADYVRPVDFAFDWEILMDPAGGVKWTSPAVEQITGYTADACHAMPEYPLALISPEDAPLVRAAVEQCRNEPRMVECRIVRRNGEIAWCNLRCRLITDAAGLPAGMRITIRDVSNEYFKQKDLQKERDRLECLLKASPFVILELDARGVVQAIYGAALPVQQPRSALLGRLLFDCVLDGRPALENALRRLIEGQPVEPVPARWRIGDAAPVPVSIVPVALPDKKMFLAFVVEDDLRRATDALLQESEMRYRRLVESVTDYIYTVTVQNGRVVKTRHGPGCVAVTGYTSMEYEANPFLWVAMVPEADKPLVLAQADKILKGEDVQPLEHRLIHKDGHIIWVKNAPVPHYNEHGVLTGYDGMVSNITARRLAEESIIEHAGTLELLNRVILAANHAVDLQSLLNESLNASLSLLHFDFAEAQMLDAEGRRAELALSLRTPPGFNAARRQIRVIESPLRRVFELGEPVFAGNGETEALNMSGEALCSIPLISKNRIIGAFNLVSRRKHVFTESERETLLAIGRQVGTAVEKIRSERALRESEARYRIITEHSLTGIFILAEGRIIFANEGFAKILGLPLRHILAWDLAQFMDHIHPDDKAYVADQNRRKLDADADVQPVFDCRLITSQGSIKWILLHSRSIEFAEGKALAGVAVDITDRKLAEQAVAAVNSQLRSREEQLRAVNEQLFGVIEQLKASERELVGANAEKEILMKEIHHRVKNNLQVISSLLNLQSAHVADPAAVALLKDCQSRIKSMALVHEQLCQARNLAEIDIEEYIRTLTNQLFVMYGTASAGITLSISTTRVHLGLDRAIPCSLIINELVSNSLKYGFPGGRKGEIRVELESAPDGNFRLTVSDNGVGLPDGVDYRNSKSLGLQLVMTFVEQLGGKISLDRSKGTRFIIDFLADASMT